MMNRIGVGDLDLIFKVTARFKLSKLLHFRASELINQICTNIIRTSSCNDQVGFDYLDPGFKVTAVLTLL